jgi:citrate lyase subunit beta/citryl-CoA lyase
MKVTSRKGPWYRSMLYVPGHRKDMMLKTPRFQPDAVIFDLEDSVPMDARAEARRLTAEALGALANEPFGRHVRVNPWGEGLTLDDLLSVTIPGLDGINLSKTEGPEDIVALDRVLSELEEARGIDHMHIEIVPAWETAPAMRKAYEICEASERVRRTAGLGLAVPGADMARALGIRLGAEGYEALPFGTRAALDARAAGVVNIISGMTAELKDMSLVRRVAVQARSFGANGGLAFHPVHVPVLHEVFTPTEAEIAKARGIVSAMTRALETGNAAIRHEGVMIDYAHLRAALDLLHQCADRGVEVGPIPEGDVPSL